MIVKCAWCRKIIGFGFPIFTLQVSHGICKKCLAKQLKEEKNVEKTLLASDNGRR